jgi:hypothetical protein
VLREYGARKPCAPYCTINCVQRVAIFDNWRDDQKTTALLRSARPARPTGEPPPAPSGPALAQ